MTEYNLNESNGVTKEELDHILLEAKEAGSELSFKLQKVKIQVEGAKSPELISAIRAIFGDNFIFTNGNSVITYDMYCYVMKLIREIGKEKAKEVL